jgi:urea transporter
MSITFSANGLQIFMKSVLRGVGQVMFQNNALTGLIFLCGIFYQSPLYGLATLVGSLTSTMTAYLFNLDLDQKHNGLYGFNGALVALGLIYFLEANFSSWCYAALAAATSTVIMQLFLKLLSKNKLPTLTAPFVVTTLIFLSVNTQLNLSRPAIHSAISPFENGEWKGIIQGISQVFFQENTISGLLMLLGLLINSKRAFIWAIIGSTTGYITGSLLSAPHEVLGAGVYGFNGALTALALGSVFLSDHGKNYAITIMATILTTLSFVGISKLFLPLGLPVMTLPFVLVTWVFILLTARN